MNTQDTTRETLASNEELALRLAKLELRVAVHDEILNFLKSGSLLAGGICNAGAWPSMLV
jgi:hypothetical protein